MALARIRVTVISERNNSAPIPVTMMISGQMAMLPPTWWTLGELAERGTVPRALADPPPMHRYTVGWTTDGDDVVMALPGDPSYPGDDPLEGT